MQTSSIGIMVSGGMPSSFRRPGE